MKPFEVKNGFVVYDERDISFREYSIQQICAGLYGILRDLNSAWRFYRVETPILIPAEEVSKEYDESYYFKTSESLALRPETTFGSYQILLEMLNSYTHKLPLCVWQAGKSFRNEQDKTFKNIRFKEFYQLEFQCAYAIGSKADYFQCLLDAARTTIQNLVKSPFEIDIEPSDRLPSYSTKTWDIIEKNEHMEIASVSMRADFYYPIVEVAIGLDRLLRFQ